MAQRRVTVVGLGAMGSGMAHALLAAGFPVTVFNRTAAKAAPLAARGATLAPSVAAAADGAEVVLLSLADEAAVTEVLDTAVSRLKPGATVVDTTTVSPQFARATAERLAEHGLHRVEACVIGNPRMAREGQLRILTAGDESIVDTVSDVLRACGQEVRHVGPAGLASTVKLAFNLLLGVQTAGLAEAVALAEAAGVDRTLLLDAIDNSGWRSPVLSFRAGYMRERRYAPAGFRAALMHKDLSLAVQEAQANGVALPVVERAMQRYSDVLASGRGDDDAAVLAEVAQAPVAAQAPAAAHG
ncbi:MAG TPA: NAD(P)-dependent oxidoreductase [Micromonosporaceae bacterium]|nr:NAD(P)-dependent oxidoreductase [Micromonosporaceae bacterium]